MSFILRVDVDKPYGTSNLFNRLRSKISEDFWYPKNKVFRFNYLYHLNKLIKVCNEGDIKGYFYFRHCTIPDSKTLNLLKEGRHKIGFHAENTQSFEAFKAELLLFEKLVSAKIESFTKHGSGSYKLGKNHFPAYEPHLYKDWSEIMNIKYPFGNEICEEEKDFEMKDNFFPKMFWLEHEYRGKNISTIEEIIDIAKFKTVPLIIHPCNFDTLTRVKHDFLRLIKLSKEAKIEWVLLN